MLRLRALVGVVCFCLFSPYLTAQAPGTGLYAFGSFDNRGFDSINIGNLNVHFEIPIVNKAGRGVPFKYTIVYDGLIWAPVDASGIQQWTPDSGWGFHGQVNDGFAGHLNYHTETFKCFTDPSNWYWSTRTSRYVYYDAFGQQHYFNYATDDCLGTTTGDGSSSDGSGYRFNGSFVANRYGSELHVPENNVSGAGSITDTNGNVINNNGDGTFTDTLGVTTALAITGGGSASSPRTFTYKIANQADLSTMAAVTMSYATYTVQTNFGCSDSSSTPIAEYGPLSIDLVDRITLADGTFYKFNYETTPGASPNVTGRLSSITLPTGGTISYQYSGGCNGNGINADGTVGSLARSQTDGPRNYTRSPSTNGSVTTLQDESGNQSQYTFTNVNGMFYETHRKVYQGAASGTPLLDQQTCYNGGTNCDGVSFTLPIAAALVTSSLNGGAQSSTRNYYDPSSQLLTSTVNYDFNTNGGASIQSTGYSYAASGRISNIQVNDGSGRLVSQTTYGYDEGSSPTVTSGIPQHGQAPGTRGNQTSSHAWINTGGTIDTATTYYDTGIPISSTGPTGATQYTFDSGTQGFLTQITPPTPSSGVSLPSYASYDVNSGIQLSASDANNGPSTPQLQYAQYDKLLRPKQVNTVDGGSTSYNYYSPADTGGPASSNAITTLNSSVSANTSIQYDGYGRTTRLAVFNGQSSNPWYQTDYCYDATGNLHFQSTEYQGNGWSTPIHCSGTGTTYTYDALGRVTNINNADGNTTYQYNGRAVLVTDVNGVKKITQTDALGRISAVCEISSNSLQGDSPQNCGLDFSGTGYLTTYAYDLYNHKTTITQGQQQRVFQTDSLGRTIMTQEPESGQITYSYTYLATGQCTGVGLCVTRVRPRANQTNPNLTTTTTTQYDAAGRVLTVSYNDGTPTKSYTYDQATAWGNSSLSLGASKGRLTEVIASTSLDWTGGFFVYDSMGRVSRMDECLPSGCGSGTYERSLSFTYDLAGDLKSTSDGAGVTTSYTYSPASEVTGVTSSMSGANYPSSLVSNLQSGPFGPNSYQLGNGLGVAVRYDGLGRVNAKWLCNNSTQQDCAGGTQLYNFNSAQGQGRIISSCDSVEGQCASYGYDEFNRLTSRSVFAGTVQNFSYSYDRYGNRLGQSVTSGSGPSPSFSISKSNNQIITSGFSYDAAGNLTNDGNHSYTYDAEGNITQVDGGSTAKYYYNAFNQRVRADAGGTSREYIFNLSGQRVSVWDGNTHAQVQGQYYWGGTPVAFYSGGSLHFQHQDWLGTERLRTSYNGGTEGSYTSLPWGDSYAASGADNDPSHFAQLDHDTESNTEHAQFRNYSSTQGRWLSPDPYSGSYSFGDPQSFNRYAYARNNPLRFTDTSGLNEDGDDPCDIFTCFEGVGGGGGVGGGDGGGGGGGGQCLANCDVPDPNPGDNPPNPPAPPGDPFPVCGLECLMSGPTVSFSSLSLVPGGGSGGGAPIKAIGPNPCAHANPAKLNYGFQMKGETSMQHIMNNHMMPGVSTETDTGSLSGGKSVYAFNYGNPNNLLPEFGLVMGYNALTLNNGVLTGQQGTSAAISFFIPGSSVTSGGSFIGFDSRNQMAPTNVNTLVVILPACVNVVNSYPGLPG